MAQAILAIFNPSEATSISKYETDTGIPEGVTYAYIAEGVNYAYITEDVNYAYHNREQKVPVEKDISKKVKAVQALQQ